MVLIGRQQVTVGDTVLESVDRNTVHLIVGITAL